MDTGYQSIRQQLFLHAMPTAAGEEQEVFREGALTLVGFDSDELEVCYSALDLCSQASPSGALEIYIHDWSEVMHQSNPIQTGLVIAKMSRFVDMRNVPLSLRRLDTLLNRKDVKVVPVLDLSRIRRPLLHILGPHCSVMLNDQSGAEDFAAVMVSFLNKRPAIHGGAAVINKESFMREELLCAY